MSSLRGKYRYEGNIFPSKAYGNVIVTKYESSRCIHIKFLNTGYETTCSMWTLVEGRFKDLLAPSVVGVGFLGLGKLEVGFSKSKAYKHWDGMLRRCYCPKTLQKHPRYLGCEVSDTFKNFTLFKEWYEKQVGHEQIGWHLDKDLLVKGNKIYSETTCCFLPPLVNLLLTKGEKRRGNTSLGVTYNKSERAYKASLNKGSQGYHYLGRFKTDGEAFQAYKTAKELYIKEVAEEWKGLIDERAYQALQSWVVEPND